MNIIRSDGVKYKNLKDAADSVGGQASHISECARDIDHRHTHKGWRWKYDTMGETKNKENT